MKKDKLTIQQHDDDTITIEGVKYANQFFRELGRAFPDLAGQTLRVDQKEDGVLRLSFVDIPLIRRLNTDKPGLYIAHLKSYVSAKVRDAMKTEIEELLNEQAKGSKVLILGPEFDHITVGEEIPL